MRCACRNADLLVTDYSLNILRLYAFADNQAVFDRESKLSTNEH